MMDLIVISPEGERADEIPVLAQMCALGLRRYQVRKPGWSAARLREWLLAVPAEIRSRLVLHSHHELVEPLKLGGRHWRDQPGVLSRPTMGEGVTSCSCHRLEDLQSRVGSFETVLFSPVFASGSKPGRPAPRPEELTAVAEFLRKRSREQRGTRVIALSGVTPERVVECAALGFDGVAVMGGILGRAADGSTPLLRFDAYQSACRAVLAPIMCLTQDGVALSHLDQVRQLCEAGARCVQLRVKGLDDVRWLELAREATRICHAHDAFCLINDRPDLAAAAGADGAHVGKLDGDWREARHVLGPGKYLGGTVNNEEEARRAVAAGCLDYVGVGPLRFTATKQKLAPVLGVEGIRRILAELKGLPAWVIGGVVASDLPAIRGTGAAGVAVSSVLYREGGVAKQFAGLTRAWPSIVPEPAELSASVP